MEAMALKLPCVVSIIRGNTDLIQQEFLQCDPTKPTEFYKAIEVLTNSYEKRQIVGTENYNRVQLFSDERVILAMKNIYSREFF